MQITFDSYWNVCCFQPKLMTCCLPQSHAIALSYTSVNGKTSNTIPTQNQICSDDDNTPLLYHSLNQWHLQAQLCAFPNHPHPQSYKNTPPSKHIAVGKSPEICLSIFKCSEFVVFNITTGQKLYVIDRRTSHRLLLHLWSTHVKRLLSCIIKP